ncbi:MAG: helix-turn-helix domain-containing protein [Blastocatellia bacterium]
MSGKKTREINCEIGSGNVFADIGLDDADELYTRTALGIQVMRILKERNYSQKEAADFLGLKQPEVSAIMRAKFSRFSQERLIGFLNRLNQKVAIHVSLRRKREPYQQVTFAPARESR